MPRFYIISNDSSEARAKRGAKSLSKALKEFGLPHATKVTHSVHGWLICVWKGHGLPKRVAGRRA